MRIRPDGGSRETQPSSKLARPGEFVDKISGGQDFEEFEREFFRSVRPTSLLKRFERVEEIANVVAFVCSPLASAINGAAVRADGGVVKSAF